VRFVQSEVGEVPECLKRVSDLVHDLKREPTRCIPFLCPLFRLSYDCHSGW
jgi:hypothetical protein